MDTTQIQLSELFCKVEKLADYMPISSVVYLSGTESGFLRYFVSREHPNLILTINLEQLNSDNPHFTIAIELSREALLNKEPFAHLDFNAQGRSVLCSDFFTNRNRILAYFALASFSPTADDLADFTSYLHQLMETNSFYDIFKKLEVVM